MNRKLSITLIFLSIIGIALAQSTVQAQPTTINFSLTQQSLAEMPKTTVYAELYCDGFLLTGADWSGVQLSYLLSYLNATSEANSIQFTASDGYSVAIPIQLAQSSQTIIAYQINGQPLPEELRLILPDYNGASWISHIVSLSVSDAIVASPAFISVGGGMIRNTIGNSNTQTDPAPTPVPPTPSSTPVTSPKPVTSIPAPTSSPSPLPLNSTAIDPTPTYQPVGQQSMSLDPLSITAVIVVVIICLSAGTMAYRRRNKNSD